MALTKITRGVIKANENYDTHNINSTGIVTAVSANFTGDVSIGGTLTYQDVTNIDSVGVITARDGLHVTSGSIFHYGSGSASNPAITLSGTAPSDTLVTTSTGKVGIGTDNPANILHLSSTGTPTIQITDEDNSGIVKIENGSGSLFLNADTGNTVSNSRIQFGIDGSERIRIDSSGRLNTGSTSAPGTVGGFSHINVHGTGINANGAISLYRNSASPSAGQGIGAIYFANSDGNPGAYIQGQSDGTWGTNDYPGRLVFFTTSDGASSATERLRITSDGKVGINESSPSYRLHIKETTVSSNYAFVENTTAGNSGIRLKNSQGDYVVFVGPDFRVYDFTNSVDRLRIDSSGRILKGMSSSLLGSSDVQLTGSGGPAKIAGYKSDNNPTANTSMLTVTGYSQSGSTFAGIGEIDFRCDNRHATSSGSHSGSIVTRVNGGNTSGTYGGGYAYSYNGLQDRERITRRSKRYYCLPDIASGSEVYNLFREEWDYQHPAGFNQYSWYRFTSHSSSSSRGGSVDIRVTWSTRHAAGNGYGHYAFHWRDSHANGYMEIGNVYRYHQNHLSGSYYGWSGSPQLDVYEINDSGNNAGFYLRVQGHVDANSSTYDGGVMHQFTISAHTNAYSDKNNFEFVGNTPPSDVGSLQSLVNLP